MRTGSLRLLGAARCAYGLVTARRPGLLARPSELADPHGDVGPHTGRGDELGQAIGDVSPRQGARP
ncbi:hypothetical protein [Streptomyces sp. NPDC057363]|uniref:hypothetical protein n=1 Tax=Streptomyces sp. NPDC057363 TaxID=3346107 RepID=UPI003632230B